MGGERPVDPACSDPCCGRGHKRPDVPQAIQRGFRMLWRGGCPVCDPRDWRRSTGSVAIGLMECGSRYTVEDSGFHAQFNTLRGIPPAITISMREWDLRSHGPMFAKMDSTPRLPRLDGMATGHTSACHAFCRNMFPLGHGAMICCVCAAMRATPGSPCYPYGITGCMVDGSRDIYRHWAHVCP